MRKDHRGGCKPCNKSAHHVKPASCRDETLMCGRISTADIEGPLAVSAACGVAQLEEGSIGGVRSWKITSKPIASNLLERSGAFNVTFGASQFSNTDPPTFPPPGFFAVRQLAPATATPDPDKAGFSSLTIELFLVDETGTPIDPADPRLGDLPVVPFMVRTCGTDVFIAEPSALTAATRARSSLSGAQKDHTASALRPYVVVRKR